MIEMEILLKRKDIEMLDSEIRSMGKMV